jgi:hypothetical protein
VRKLRYVVELEVDDCARGEDVRLVLAQVVRSQVAARSRVSAQCCERDRDLDGNCDRHPAPRHP